MDFLSSLLHPTTPPLHHQLTPAPPLHLASATCDPYICSSTRTGRRPDSIGGALSSPFVPHPKAPKTFRRLIALPFNSRSSLYATTWENSSGHGSLVWDNQPRRDHKPTLVSRRHTQPPVRFQIKGPTLLPSSQLVVTSHLPHLARNTFQVANHSLRLPRTSHTFASHLWPGKLRPHYFSPRLASRRKSSQPQKAAKQLRRFRLEVKRDAKFDSFNLSRHHAKFGKLDLQCSPGRRFMTSVVLKASIWRLVTSELQGRGHTKRRMVARQRKSQGNKQLLLKSANPAAAPRSWSAKPDVRKSPVRKRHDVKGHSRFSPPSRKTISKPVQLSPIQLNHLQRKYIQRKMQRAQAKVHARNASLKSELEYRWKENSYSFLLAIDSSYGALSLRSRTNPLRFTPRIQLPLGSGRRERPWICWVHEPKSGFGEVQLGRKGLELAADWQNPRVILKQKGSNGSLTRVSLNKKKVVTIDKTLIVQPILGASVLTMNAHMSSAKNEGTLMATVTAPIGLISVSASTSRAINFMADIHISKGRQAYSIGLKVEEAKNFAARLGFYY